MVSHFLYTLWAKGVMDQIGTEEVVTTKKLQPTEPLLDNAAHHHLLSGLACCHCDRHCAHQVSITNYCYNANRKVYKIHVSTRRAAIKQEAAPVASGIKNANAHSSSLSYQSSEEAGRLVSRASSEVRVPLSFSIHLELSLLEVYSFRVCCRYHL